jgi:hypothetical protein
MTVPNPFMTGGDPAPSFFARQFNEPSANPLIAQQVDITAPQEVGVGRISDPAAPAQNAQLYVTNFDPDLYNLSPTSHLMRLIRAIVGASGLDGIRRQMLLSKISSMIKQGSFIDLDRFYGAIFGLHRQAIELMPKNTDGTQVNPYTDLAPSDVWDQAISADARYRARLAQLVAAIGMGATLIGLKTAAESIVNDDVDVTESWVRVDYGYDQSQVPTPTNHTYGQLQTDYSNWGGLKTTTYGQLTGTIFGIGQLPAGVRSEVIFTPRRPITVEEKFQLQMVLNKLKPAGVTVTVGSAQVASKANVPARRIFSDSEEWQVHSRVTPAIGLVSPTKPIYPNANNYTISRPALANYSGEKWSYNGTVVDTTSYRRAYGDVLAPINNESITYTDTHSHVYKAPDGLKDTRAAMSARLSGEGAVTTMPFSEIRGRTS